MIFLAVIQDPKDNSFFEAMRQSYGNSPIDSKLTVDKSWFDSFASCNPNIELVQLYFHLTWFDLTHFCFANPKLNYHWWLQVAITIEHNRCQRGIPFFKKIHQVQIKFLKMWRTGRQIECHQSQVLPFIFPSTHFMLLSVEVIIDTQRSYRVFSYFWLQTVWLLRLKLRESGKHHNNLSPWSSWSWLAFGQWLFIRLMQSFVLNITRKVSIVYA